MCVCDYEYEHMCVHEHGRVCVHEYVCLCFVTDTGFNLEFWDHLTSVSHEPCLLQCGQRLRAADEVWGYTVSMQAAEESRPWKVNYSCTATPHENPPSRGKIWSTFT